MGGSARRPRSLLLLGGVAALALIVAAGIWLQASLRPGSPSAGLAIGAAVPSLAQPATSGQSLTLDQLRGSKVVLYFYEAAG